MATLAPRLRIFISKLPRAYCFPSNEYAYIRTYILYISFSSSIFGYSRHSRSLDKHTHCRIEIGIRNGPRKGNSTLWRVKKEKKEARVYVLYLCVCISTKLRSIDKHNIRRVPRGVCEPENIRNSNVARTPLKRDRPLAKRGSLVVANKICLDVSYNYECDCNLFPTKCQALIHGYTVIPKRF